MKAIKVLLENGHWEGAAGIARQLLELSLSLERIFAIEEDAEAAALKFVRFGLLQQARYVQVREKFMKKFGYAEDSQVAERVADEILAVQFPEFLAGRRRDGSAKWQESWCGKTARAMSRESMLETREDQYELLYRFWSEQIHATPASMMPAIFWTSEPDWMRRVLYEDDKKIVETIANSVNIFLEIWAFIPIFRLTFDRHRSREWIDELKNLQLKPYPPDRTRSLDDH